ncbi:hypothetical protein LY16_01923 [Xenorhabdus doucetiae]|uniref:Uncharacterized protein n=1 Tax=Xenorhabdus doucetiae TaxID=351671 RepID=A0ABY3NRA4_9GAMM|nr:hypothetical protein LY16_01923 [Xenorhabdus doucetiae]
MLPTTISLILDTYHEIAGAIIGGFVKNALNLDHFIVLFY